MVPELDGWAAWGVPLLYVLWVLRLVPQGRATEFLLKTLAWIVVGSALHFGTVAEALTCALGQQQQAVAAGMAAGGGGGAGLAAGPLRVQRAGHGVTL